MDKQILILEVTEKNFELLNKILSVGGFLCKRILNLEELNDIKHKVHEYGSVVVNSHIGYIDPEKIMKICKVDGDLPIPTIFIDSSMEPNSKILKRCFSHGASEYIKKPFDADEILYRVSHIHTSYMKIKEYKLRVEKLAKLATVDQLSKLTSKMHMQAILKHQINYFNRYKNDTSIIYLSLLNVDKTVGIFGLSQGEKLISHFAKELKSKIRESDALARWEGSEFIVLLSNTDIKSAQELVRKLNLYFSRITFLKQTRIELAFGITHFDKGDEIQTIIERAKVALKQAKKQEYKKVFVA